MSVEDYRNLEDRPPPSVSKTWWFGFCLWLPMTFFSVLAVTFNACSGDIEGGSTRAGVCRVVEDSDFGALWINVAALAAFGLVLLIRGPRLTGGGAAVLSLMPAGVALALPFVILALPAQA